MIQLPGFLGRPSVTNRPPTQEEIRRNDLILLAFVMVLIAAGWLIVRWSAAPARTQALGPGLPEVAWPASWLLSAPEGETLFSARNPSTASLFSATMRVVATPALPVETLATLRPELGLRRSRELDRYRELSAEPVTVIDGQPALLVTYAYVADPTQDSGGNGLPVVVEAQDLIFRSGDQWITASVAADAADVVGEQAAFDLFLRSLGLVRGTP